jgi:hypothetical protein
VEEVAMKFSLRTLLIWAMFAPPLLAVFWVYFLKDWHARFSFLAFLGVITAFLWLYVLARLHP